MMRRQRPAYLSQKPTRPVPTKQGGLLRTIAEARDYMLALPDHRELRQSWQRAAELLLAQAAREGSALFDHDLVGRNRRRLLRGLHMERSFRVGERDN